MFGGGTRYVDTLDAIIEFVDGYNPATDELVGWHRGRLQRSPAEIRLCGE